MLDEKEKKIVAWEFSRKLKSIVDDDEANEFEEESSVPPLSRSLPKEEEEADVEELAWRSIHEKKDTIIGKTCMIQGNIQLEEEKVVVLGRVEGNVVGKGDVTLSSAGTVIGDISCRNFTLVCGELIGDLECEGDVAVYSEGRLEGVIKRAYNVESSGMIKGNIHAQGLTSLTGSAHLEGDLSTARIKIEDGAFLSGKVTVVSEALSQACDEQQQSGVEEILAAGQEVTALQEANETEAAETEASGDSVYMENGTTQEAM